MARVLAGETDAPLTEAALEAGLATAGSPPLDLIVRTSGEQRLSNFLLWEAAYAELVFQDILWPDYGPEALGRAVAEFRARDRRFGGRSLATFDRLFVSTDRTTGGQVSDVSNARLHHKLVAQVLVDGLGLGRGFHDDQRFAHGSESS